MLALSTYSVIAPEGCAAILFRQVTEDTIAAALEILQPTAEHMLQYGIIDAIMTRTPSSRIRTISPPPWPLSPRCSRGPRPSSPVLPLMFYSRELQEKIARCGRMAEPQPWYRRGRRFAKRLWSFSRPAVTTDPYIADIRRHVFGNSDCTPQACNTVKDADGNVVRHGCGHLFPAEDFRQHWHACPACHRPDPLIFDVC